MSKPVVGLFLAASLVAITPMSSAQQKLDIVQIMGQFVQAEYAASQCLKPDEQTLSKFNSNYRIVSVRATEEMMKRRPGLTEQQVSEQFKKGADAVHKQMDDVIRTKGCSDPRIQDLLKRFEIQANMKL